ncbi:MAG TPA: translocation/assembly module TamB domain-containing protein [Pyrinomonadaceae bacterium]|jgi:translocation and assembly module TamB|nr:translocation/assembly module TamB domain-containing protein [Pyrinomonadaceae bacterium]
MPEDFPDDAPQKRSPEETKKSELAAALQSETDEPLPPAAERLAERDADRPNPVTPQGWHRRWLTRRNAFILTIVIAVGIVALILVAILAYRLGYVDRYVANQIKSTMAEYGIRAEIGEFHTLLNKRTVEMRGIELYDAQTGAHLGKIERMLATVRIEDLYALNLRRNVNLESLVIDGLEVWVEFDAEGRSNFGNLKLPPPDPNRRILFSYSTATVRLNSGVIHYGDKRHDISGEARNLVATIQPDNPSAPAASWMNTVTLAASDSTFVYDGRPVNNIDFEATGRINQTRAEIQKMVLRSPVAEAHLAGTMDDWRELSYQLQVTSMRVDLTQTSDLLQTDTALRGVGDLSGTISGKGSQYSFNGQVKSDALAADNIRLQALNATARVSGEGKTYNATGEVVAELLTAGDFQLNAVHLAGNVMGTGTDFSWIGDLRAAAARTGGRTISGLILSDARAEKTGETLKASAARVSANGFSSADAQAGGLSASDLRLQSEGGVTKGSAANVQAGTINASGARVEGVAGSGVEFVDRDGTTNVNVNALRVGRIAAQGAKVGSLNIAGVRLTIRGGRIEGTSGDINAGTVAFTDGRAENVRLARPAFTVEPSGRYRASADLSLGGGVLGQFNLGPARASLVATNSQIQLNNFTAEAFKGRATGNAVLSTARGGTSRVVANFSGMDIGGLLALSGRVVPVSGRATGTVDLAFPGTSVKAASGDVRAQFEAETGAEAGGRTPVTGAVALHADSGVFKIEQANLRTGATELTASGQFSFDRDETNLKLDLASGDAAEFQDVLVASGLFPALYEELDRYGIGLGGRLAFNGTVSGRLNNPVVDGRASIDRFSVKGRELGSLSTALNITPEVINLTDGRLTEPDGGGVQFTLNAPRTGSNNIELNATLERANAGNLLAVLPQGKQSDFLGPGDFTGDLSGNINIRGLPDAMNGAADLRVGPGAIRGEPFQSMSASATFQGSTITLQNLEARLNAGLVKASGTINNESGAFDLDGRATDFRLERLESLALNAGTVPRLTGTANLNIHARGAKFTDFATYQIDIDGEGRDVTVNGHPAGTLTLTGRTENKIFDLRLTTGLLGQPQVVAARVDLGNPQLPATIETTLTGADLTSLFSILLPQSNVRVTGRATGTLRAVGNLRTENEEGEDVFSLAGLKGTANFTELGVQIEDIQLTATSPLLVQFSSNEVFFEKTQFTGPGTNIVFGGTAAIGPGGRQSLTVDGQLNLRVLNSISPNVFLSGTAEAAVRVGGSYEEPRLSGTASVAGASVATLIGDERLMLSNVKGLVRFNSDRVQIDTLTGTLGGGRVTASGGALLEGFTLARFRLNVHGDDVTVPFPEGFRSTADADLDINGSTREQIITGVVNLRRAEYTEDIELADLLNRRGEASLTEGGGGGAAFGATTQVDLRVEGRDALVVRNNLADVVGSVSLRIVGPVEDPIISGRIAATRGTLNFRNDRYELMRAFVDLPARRDADPILNIQAESEIRGYTVIVSLTGPLSQPQATVRSDPSLPQSDVVSLITTGNLSSGDTSASTLAQTGLGTAASLLTDTLINAPARRATDRLFGLNRFEIDPLIAGRGGASPTARLTVGRQINRNLSITYSTNVTSDQNQVLALEYRVSNRLSFVARYEQGSVNGFSSRNDNFSFEIRFRKRF